ncbi:MAG: GNAT family N-acetyltransferase [Treponemataceae bacterium]|nr:GNAT family N-acetyltransferase [Treponemataceae bacterium]
MKPEYITEEKVSFFFNKYKFNSDLIFHLKRKLLHEAHDFGEWQQYLAANSDMTRNFFTQNERLLDEFIRPAIADPERLHPGVIHEFLSHITFFQVENNIDALVTRNIILAFLEHPECLNERNKFDAMLNLGIFYVLTRYAPFSETMDCFQKAMEIYPDFASADSDDTRAHQIFCLGYEFLAYDLYRSNDFAAMSALYDRIDGLLHSGSEELFHTIWGKDADVRGGIEMLMRYFRVCAVFAAGQSGFRAKDGSAEQQAALKRIVSWLNAEYAAEKREGTVSCMIFTYFQKARAVFRRITVGQYSAILTAEFQRRYEHQGVQLAFPENAILMDVSAVNSCFASLLDTLKLFCDSFSYVNVFLPELYRSSTQDGLRRNVIKEMAYYYEQGKYAEKGFLTDSFVIENICLISGHFKTAQDFIPFLQMVFTHREVSSAIHFSMVSTIAGICLTHFIEQKPELFTIPGLFEDSAAVLRHKNELLDFIKRAGLLHDIGKIGCSNVVNLHFRKITDYEFGIIRNHPLSGAALAERIPFLRMYRDIIIGHHKMWGDSGGYPAEFKSSASILQTFIALITICDCIDSVTDSQGRNYAVKKTFDDVLSELKESAGTRYSPELVALIDEDESLKEELRYVTTTMRNYTSYRMYQQFVSPTVKHSVEDNKEIREYSPEFLPELRKFYLHCYPDAQEKIDMHLDEFTGNKSSRMYILCDKGNTVFGVVSGCIITPITSEERFFLFSDIIVMPEERRKGWGIELMLFTWEHLKKERIRKVKTNVSNDFKTESFFWISGFSTAKEYLLERNL